MAKIPKSTNLSEAVHKETKTLLAIMVVLAAASVALYFMAGQMPHWMHHEGLGEEEARLHHIHVGLYQAVVLYISIAFAIFTFVSFCIGLLTVLKLDKERTEAPAH